MKKGRLILLHRKHYNFYHWHNGRGLLCLIPDSSLKDFFGPKLIPIDALVFRRKSKKYRDRVNSLVRKTRTRFLYSVLKYNFLRHS